MGLEFTWDPAKAAANLRKHGISFAEAATAFGDPHSLTIADPDHSEREDRYLLIGLTGTNKLVVVAHTEHGDTIRIISARRATRRERPMKKTRKRKAVRNGMRAQYDFSGGVRGKYAARFRAGTNLVVLDPDVAATFRDSQSVNRALRAIIEALPARRPRRARSA